MKKTFLVTVPIFYPSSKLHIGHFFTLSIAESLIYFKRLMKYDVLFVAGSDEHGEKIQKIALQNNMEPQEYVDKQWEYFNYFLKKCEFNPDVLTRTTAEKHKETVKNIFLKMKERKDIYKDYYVGWYSVNDEEFVANNNVIKEADKYLHPISKHELRLVSFPSYFFNVEKYEEWIKKIIKDNKLNLFKLTQKELLNSFLENKLKDLSISRDTFEWGIKVPGDREHIIYVWFDALLSYLSSVGFQQSDDSLFQKFWDNGSEILQIIGKEISRFHCIYWPIFLKSLNLRQPSKILVHGWILSENQKMSKSKGNVLDPLEIIKEYSPEVLRYFILSRSSLVKDISLSLDSLKIVYNEEIVNIFGNLHSRTVNLFHQKTNKKIRYVSDWLNDDDISILEGIRVLKEDFINSMNEGNIFLSLRSLAQFGLGLNVYFERKKPWKMDGNSRDFSAFISVIFNSLYALDVLLSIFMPNSSKHYLRILGYEEIDIELIEDFEKFDNVIPRENVILYKRK